MVQWRITGEILFGEDSHLTNIFSDGLKLPTSYGISPFFLSTTMYHAFPTEDSFSE